MADYSLHVFIMTHPWPRGGQEQVLDVGKRGLRRLTGGTFFKLEKGHESCLPVFYLELPRRPFRLADGRKEGRKGVHFQRRLRQPRPPSVLFHFRLFFPMTKPPGVK